MSRSTRFAPYIDDTLLDPKATPEDVDALCARAQRHRVAAVCVNPAWVQRCVESLAGSSVAVAAVVGIPFGASEPARKAALVEMIIESALLTPEEIVHACEIARRAGTLAFRELGQ